MLADRFLDEVSLEMRIKKIFLNKMYGNKLTMFWDNDVIFDKN